MNNFNPKKIKLASKHLEEKLKLFKLREDKDEKKDAYIIEDKKNSSFDKIINLLFKS